MDICLSRDLYYSNEKPKFNCQMKTRRSQGYFSSLSFFLIKSLCVGVAFFAPGRIGLAIRVRQPFLAKKQLKVYKAQVTSSHLANFKQNDVFDFG